jgi:hypothetical protein
MNEYVIIATFFRYYASTSISTLSSLLECDLTAMRFRCDQEEVL